MTEKMPVLLITRPQKQSEQLLDDLTERLGRPPKFIIHPMISIKELKVNNGKTTKNFRAKISEEAFSEVSYYDSIISNYMCRFNKKKNFLNPHIPKQIGWITVSFKYFFVIL